MKQLLTPGLALLLATAGCEQQKKTSASAETTPEPIATTVAHGKDRVSEQIAPEIDASEAEIRINLRSEGQTYSIETDSLRNILHIDLSQIKEKGLPLHIAKELTTLPEDTHPITTNLKDGIIPILQMKPGFDSFSMTIHYPPEEKQQSAIICLKDTAAFMITITGEQQIAALPHNAPKEAMRNSLTSILLEHSTNILGKPCSEEDAQKKTDKILREYELSLVETE